MVAGIDGSPGSLAAARWAARETLLRQLPLRLVHARPCLPMLLPSSRAAELREREELLPRIESELVRMHPGLQVSSVQVVDTAPAALLAASEDADLLVLGARGCGGFDGLPVGSVNLRVAARAYCPVLTVRRARRAPGRVRAAPSEIVLGLDARHPSEAALAFAFDSADRRHAVLRVLHAWAPPDGHADARPALDEEELLAEELQIWRKQYPDLEVVEQVVAGHPAGALVSASAHAELLVIGRPRASGAHRPGLGPVADAVLHQAATSVALVPRGEPLGWPDPGCGHHRQTRPRGHGATAGPEQEPSAEGRERSSS
jgi:nucleotide-binding universal stress UspA family protein